MWKQVSEDFWAENRSSKVGDVEKSVTEIIEKVRKEGDAALFELTKKFDGTDLKLLEVTREEIEDAYDTVDPVLVEELENAAYNIQRFHEMQVPPDLWIREVEPGVTLGVKSTPLDTVGCYVPGGRASYPSTALMCVIPARVAGVGEVICCTPAPVNPVTLVAMDIAGADTIFKIGGAQAVAAMALGTESVPKVQKIVGPGNVYVTSAKMLLRNEVEIDFPAGPSEIGVLADSSADARYLAADLIAQAEHDPSAASIMITDDPDLPDEVWEHMESMIENQPRKEIILKALDNSGYIVATDMELASEIMDRIAPEHLSIQTSNPMDMLNRVKNAGSIFIGPYTPVAAGDYASGTNHVLPTAGHSSTASGLNVAHFRKTSTVQMLTPEGLDALAPTIKTIAEAEGLIAHSHSVDVRFEE
ncbi:MAG: histidinol dehydrogenase [Candidatus Methanomethylophilaceae archaeon]